MQTDLEMEKLNYHVQDSFLDQYGGGCGEEVDGVYYRRLKMGNVILNG